VIWYSYSSLDVTGISSVKRSGGDMCSGAALLYKIPTIVIGEHTTFRGPEDYLRSRGVELVILDSEECISLVRDFIAAKAAVWNEDIGQE
jgi:creatinine deaminase